MGDCKSVPEVVAISVFGRTKTLGAPYRAPEGRGLLAFSKEKKGDFEELTSITAIRCGFFLERTCGFRWGFSRWAWLVPPIALSFPYTTPSSVVPFGHKGNIRPGIAFSPAVFGGELLRVLLL